MYYGRPRRLERIVIDPGEDQYRSRRRAPPSFPLTEEFFNAAYDRMPVYEEDIEREYVESPPFDYSFPDTLSSQGRSDQHYDVEDFISARNTEAEEKRKRKVREQIEALRNYEAIHQARQRTQNFSGGASGGTDFDNESFPDTEQAGPAGGTSRFNQRPRRSDGGVHAYTESNTPQYHGKPPRGYDQGRNEAESNISPVERPRRPYRSVPETPELISHTTERPRRPYGGRSDTQEPSYTTSERPRRPYGGVPEARKPSSSTGEPSGRQYGGVPNGDGPNRFASGGTNYNQSTGFNGSGGGQPKTSFPKPKAAEPKPNIVVLELPDHYLTLGISPDASQDE